MIVKDVPEKSVGKRNSFIRLSLRKPKDWNVALTTSVSSPAIIPPEIQLWDEERGDVLLNTTQSCVRSKSASFTRKRGSSSENQKNTFRNQDSEEPYSSKKKVNNVNGLISNYYINGSQGRSKSLSARDKRDGLVKPEEYERPPTPVMVARRISLANDSSAQSLAKSALQTNGIVTHHRKQNSDSSSVGSRRKVKHSVSFGRVDTIDDSSSISSSFSLSKSNRPLVESNKQIPSCSSSPRIVITEIADTKGHVVPEERTRNGRSKHRSRSGIPLLVGNREICNSEIRNNNQSVQKNDMCNNESQKRGRKSRMDVFMSQQIGKHKFTVTRVPENALNNQRLPENAPSLTKRPFVQEQPARHHCDRGNCPFDKYLESTTSQGKDYQRNVVGKTSGESVDARKRSVKSSSGNTLVKDNISRKDNLQRDSSKKREGSKHRKNRVASRSRQEMMSSSSSDSEEWKTPRTPPRRKRMSRTPKGKTFELF